MISFQQVIESKKGPAFSHESAPSSQGTPIDNASPLPPRTGPTRRRLPFVLMLGFIALGAVSYFRPLVGQDRTVIYELPVPNSISRIQIDWLTTNNKALGGISRAFPQGTAPNTVRGTLHAPDGDIRAEISITQNGEIHHFEKMVHLVGDTLTLTIPNPPPEIAR